MTPNSSQPGASPENLGERLAVNAAALRLFKGSYRESSDRHSDALLVRDHIGVLEAALATLRAERDEALEANRRANAIIGQQADEMKGLQDKLDEMLKVAERNPPVRPSSE